MRPDELALRYVGIRERPGVPFDPFIAAWIVDAGGPSTLNDETPWCGAFVYHVAHRLLGLEAPALPMRARSWLTVGSEAGPFTRLGEPVAGDVVVLSRGLAPQPRASVLEAPGHVGFFTGRINGTLATWPSGTPGPGTTIELVSGNQDDAVTVSAFPFSRVLGVRRLRPAGGSM